MGITLFYGFNLRVTVGPSPPIAGWVIAARIQSMRFRMDISTIHD
ncbi:hypothetical protein ACG2LH_00895 [Zhouia sp. PK063]